MNYGKMKKQVLRGVARQSNLQKAATSVQRQDKMYRPDRDGPKRVAQTLPTPRPGGPSVRPIKRDPQFGRPAGPVGRPAQRPGKPGRRPMRGALASRPWRPKRRAM